MSMHGEMKIMATGAAVIVVGLIAMSLQGCTAERKPTKVLNMVYLYKKGATEDGQHSDYYARCTNLQEQDDGSHTLITRKGRKVTIPNSFDLVVESWRE